MIDLKEVKATARPMRVAYLVNFDSCSNELLDAVFAECYSRWGGRRTLIIPATEEAGISEDYKKWLSLYDPDIIYSYVNFSDDLIEKIHEDHCPLYLKYHHRYGREAEQETARDYYPDLPLSPLSSISVFPFLLDRRGLEDFSGCKILDCDFTGEPPRFLADNFGTLTKSYRNSLTAEKYPEFYKALTLISENALNNLRRANPDSREYETNFYELIKKMATRGQRILSLSMLSDYLNWYLDFYSPAQSEKFNLVIGDTPQDRILFWNFRHHYTHIGVSEIVDLVVSPENMADQPLFDEICNIIRNKSYRSHSGYPVTIRSCSLSEDQLNGYADQIRARLTHSQINIQKVSAPSDYIPVTVRHRNEPVRFRTGSNWNEPKSVSKANYSGNKVFVPQTLPIHLKDLFVPPGFRAGVWMLDLIIQRHVNHSRISNVSHVWLLPRRIRVDRKFQRLDNYSQQDHYLRTIRVNRDALPCVPVKHGMDNPVLEVREDENLISQAITSHFDFDAFAYQERPKVCRDRYDGTELSDKGRYFQGVMKHFGSIYEAEQIIMNKFWNRVFSDLGASNVDVGTQNIQKLLKHINRYFNTEIFESTEKKEIFAEKVLQTAENIKREKQFLSWSKMLEFWEKSWQEFVDENPQLADRAEEIKQDDLRTVEESTQFLCQKKIIFQGQQWTCDSCLHKNWESIEELKTTLICEVCGNKEPAPISSDWKFRLNEFILQAMRQHGTTALIWCLIQLNNRADASFYYAPSMKLIIHSRQDDTESFVECDLMALVDGDFYVCEVKSSGRVTDTELNNFVNIVNKLRPDVALLACMEKRDGLQAELARKIEGRINPGIKLEVMTLHEQHFDGDARLPNGRSFLHRIM